jgi:hypothetical protein
MTPRKIIEASNALGFGGKPSKPLTKLKPAPQCSIAAGDRGELSWEDLQRSWESNL